MKTSNYIIIAFFTALIGATLFLFVDAKNHEDESSNNIDSKEFRIPDFSVIVIETDTWLNIISRDKNKLNVVHYNTSEVIVNPGRVSNDTLYVSEKTTANSITINCTQLSSLIVRNNRNVHINNLHSDSLSVLAENAIIWIADSKIGTIHVQANNHSNIQFHSSEINHISAQLENETELYSERTTINKTTFEKDQSSKCHFY
jgi:hypothetical protein